MRFTFISALCLSFSERFSVNVTLWTLLELIFYSFYVLTPWLPAFGACFGLLDVWRLESMSLKRSSSRLRERRTRFGSPGAVCFEIYPPLPGQLGIIGERRTFATGRLAASDA
jgi:hypothetical protein